MDSNLEGNRSCFQYALVYQNSATESLNEDEYKIKNKKDLIGEDFLKLS